MTKIGPKEAKTRALREDAVCKIDHDDPTPGTVPKELCGVCSPSKSRKKPSPERKRGGDEGVTLAPPLAVQKAIAKEFAGGEPKAEIAGAMSILGVDDQKKATTRKAAAKPEADNREESAMRTKTKKKAAKQKARTAVKAKTVKAKTTGARPGSKVELVAKLLQRPQGCTTADVLKATGWPSVSMPQQAKAAGLTLKKEKDGKVTRYRAA